MTAANPDPRIPDDYPDWLEGIGASNELVAYARKLTPSGLSYDRGHRHGIHQGIVIGLIVALAVVVAVGWVR